MGGCYVREKRVSSALCKVGCNSGLWHCKHEEVSKYCTSDFGFQPSPEKGFFFRKMHAVLVLQELFDHIREKIQSQRPWGGINEHQ